MGPVDLDTLTKVATLDTLVWCDGMSEWKPIRYIPELAPLFMQHRVHSAYSAPQQFDTPRQPNSQSLLIWSIIMTIFCCAVHGAIGIIYAIKSKNAWTEGRYNDATNDFNTGKMWIIIGSIVMFILYVIFYTFYGVVWLASLGY